MKTVDAPLAKPPFRFSFWPPEGDRARTGKNPPAPRKQRKRMSYLAIRQITREISDDALNVHLPDIHDFAAAHRFPGGRKPFLRNVHADEEVQMGYARFLKFQHGDERNAFPESPSEQNAHFPPRFTQVSFRTD